MADFKIKYRMNLPDGQDVEYLLQFDEQTVELQNDLPQDLPDWTKLEFKQCSHCPLSSHTHPHCPVAAHLVSVIDAFDGIMSYDEVGLEIETGRRTISREVTAQDALSALMGLVIPASGCPHSAFFRPMARFHLPLADTSETLYRAASMYLLGQYFRKKAGQRVDLDLEGLKLIYKNMQILNGAVAERLRNASKTDSSVNAIILLDMFALALPFAVEDSLEELKSLFASYWEQ